ncbi:hypothetical protein ACHAWF_015738 [Thalassiosira exigua]
MSRQLWVGCVHRDAAAAGFAHLQSIHSGTSKKRGSDSIAATKEDGKFDATKHLYTTSARLENAANVLDAYCRLFFDNQTSRNQILQKTRHVRNYILPLLKSASESLNDAARELAPIASIKYVHNREEKRRRRDTINPGNHGMSTDLQLIQNFVSSQKTTAKPVKKLSVTPSPPKGRRRVPLSTIRPDENVSEDIHKDKHILLPAPKDGVYYRKPEVVSIISTFKEGSWDRGKAIRKMTRLELVPSCGATSKGVSIERTIRRLMERSKQGKPIFDDEWTDGRPAICSDSDIKAMAQQVETMSGSSLATIDVQRMLADVQAKKLEASGFAAISPLIVSSKTADNYAALLANEGNISIAKSTVAKTNTRFAAENSLRGSVSNVALIGSTHCIPVEKPDPDIAAELKTLPHATRMMVELVSHAWGCNVYPVRPEYIFSTDDTTEYIFEGTASKKPRFVLVSKSTIRKAGTDSVYSMDDSKSMNGMRVKLTFTFSATGTCFPLVVTVTGLTEKELPGDKDCIDILVPGLGIGGGGVGVGSDVVGHLILQRNTEGANAQRCKYIHKNVFIETVNKIRKEVDGVDVKLGDRIKKELTAISYCDGDLGQIAAIKSAVDMFIENEVICNKHNAARSMGDQPADRCHVFKCIKEQLPSHTAEHIPAENHPMKRKIVQVFEHERLKHLSLKSSKKKALINFLTVLPQIATKACTVRNIQMGFLETGMIDEDKKRYPVFNKILASCRQAITHDEYNNVLESFDDFLKVTDDVGRIPEEHFDLHAIRVDRDSKGNEVTRLAGISQEHLQRAKCLTHPFQVELRKERLKQIRWKERQKKEDANKVHQQKIDANKQVVDEICKRMQEEGIIGDSDFGEQFLTDCPIEIFDQLKPAWKLDSFILARSKDYKTKSSIPKRGKMEEAKRGEINKISIAYGCRELVNHIDGHLPFDLDEEDPEETIEDNVEVLTLTNDEDILPSQLLSNDAWVRFVVQLFDLDKLQLADVTCQSTKTKADLLARLLRERFKDHIKHRIKSPSRRSHWSMKLAYKNLSASAAIMVLSNHVKRDLRSLDELSCLLAIDEKNFLPCSSFPDRQGCYLYYDTNRGIFVRSGKVTRRGFVDRDSEHLKSSKESKPSSHFYFVYPSEQSDRADSRSKRGAFEHLLQLIGVGFDPNTESATRVDRDVNSGGFMWLSEEDKSNIEKSLSKDLASIQKYQDIVAYQMELAYDLALSPEMNVSRSPGFESFLGVFGGSE